MSIIWSILFIVNEIYSFDKMRFEVCIVVRIKFLYFFVCIDREFFFENKIDFLQFRQIVMFSCLFVLLFIMG